MINKEFPAIREMNREREKRASPMLLKEFSWSHASPCPPAAL
jgi:hypothetical protein